MGISIKQNHLLKLKYSLHISETVFRIVVLISIDTCITVVLWNYTSKLRENVEKTNQSDNLASYFDLTFTIEKKMENFLPSYMTNVMTLIFTLSVFPFLSNNIPSGSSYGVYISQLIRYARCCSCYDDFRHRHKMPVETFVSQRYQYESLKDSFRKF